MVCAVCVCMCMCACVYINSILHSFAAGVHRRYVWVPELEKLLDELSVHPDADIVRRAFEVVTFKWIAVETGEVMHDDPRTHNTLREQMRGKKKKDNKHEEKKKKENKHEKKTNVEVEAADANGGWGVADANGGWH